MEMGSDRVTGRPYGRYRGARLRQVRTDQAGECSRRRAIDHARVAPPTWA
jgi:hypothetical protein